MALLEIGDTEGQVFEAGSNGKLRLGGQKLNAAEFVNLATNGPVRFARRREKCRTPTVRLPPPPFFLQRDAQAKIMKTAPPKIDALPEHLSSESDTFCPYRFDHLDDVLDTLGSECFGTSKEKELGEKLSAMRVKQSFRVAKESCEAPSFHTAL